MLKYHYKGDYSNVGSLPRFGRRPDRLDELLREVMLDSNEQPHDSADVVEALAVDDTNDGVLDPLDHPCSTSWLLICHRPGTGSPSCFLNGTKGVGGITALFNLGYCSGGVLNPSFAESGVRKSALHGVSGSSGDDLPEDGLSRGSDDLTGGSGNAIPS